MKISRLFNSVRKRLVAGGILALAVALPVAVSAASTVAIEASTQVANASVSNPTWGSSASASYNQVVDVQVAYNNKEAANSGKVATNVRVKINIPTTAGSTQTVTTKTSADNSNTVSGSATVNLDRSDAYLQYIPGTATWEHAVSATSNQTTTEKVSDDVVTNPNGLVLGNENPCQAGSVQIQARVIVPGVSVDKYVRLKGTTNWSTSINANPGDTIQYEIAYHNTGNSTEENVDFRDQLPTGVSYVPSTTMLKNSNYPNGTNVNSDSIVTNGIIGQSYAPGAAGYVMFDAKIADESALPQCGDNKLRNIAYVQPQNMNYYYNTADVHVNKTCTTPPTYSCDSLTYTIGDNRTITANLTYTASNGATFQGATVNWDDGNSSPVTNGTASHTYATDGTYNIAAAVNFNVNGTTKTVTSDACAKQVTIKTTAPVYSCDLLTLSKTDNRTVKAVVTYTASNGATYKSSSFDWGDNSTATSGSATSASHTYSADGTYNVAATLTFDVNGTTKTVSSEGCAKSVTFTTTQTPVYSCDLLTLTKGTNRTVTASVAYTAQGGASFKTVTLDWGDNSTPLVTSNTTASYQYATDGTYTVTARVLFSVNNADVYGADTTNCVKQVSFTTPTTPQTPPELPNTGAGNVIGLFAGTVLLSAIGYRLFLGRKLAR